MRHSFVRAGSLLILSIAIWAGPAVAQVDVSGEWGSTFHEDLPHRGGMRLADYTGLTLNEAGWRKGQSWDEAARSLPERQCIPHVVTYSLRGHRQRSGSRRSSTSTPAVCSPTTWSGATDVRG
jgi:hypothetical protein